MWIPPGYVLCTNRGCDAHRMWMADRPHAHLEGDEDWLVDRTIDDAPPLPADDD